MSESERNDESRDNAPSPRGWWGDGTLGGRLVGLVLAAPAMIAAVLLAPGAVDQTETSDRR